MKYDVTKRVGRYQGDIQKSQLEKTDNEVDKTCTQNTTLSNTNSTKNQVGTQVFRKGNIKVHHYRKVICTVTLCLKDIVFNLTFAQFIIEMQTIRWYYHLLNAQKIRFQINC